MKVRLRLLQILRESMPAYISGTQLADICGVSRAAVWKHIRQLGKNGYNIESANKKGYRLLSLPVKPAEEELRLLLKTKWIGRNDIIIYDTTDSTNTRAKGLAEKGGPAGTVVLSLEQSSGRGRMGRTWFSPPGCGIYLSIILRPGFPASEAPGITLMSAVAFAETLNDFSIPALIKWPNDLLVNGRKIAGILVEMNGSADSVEYLIVGIGFNTNRPPEGYPAEIRNMACSAEDFVKGEFPVNELLVRFLEKFETCYEDYERTGFASVSERWKLLSCVMGRNVMVDGYGGLLQGRVVDIGPGGALVIQERDGTEKTVFSGDIKILD